MNSTKIFSTLTTQSSFNPASFKPFGQECTIGCGASESVSIVTTKLQTHSTPGFNFAPCSGFPATFVGTSALLFLSESGENGGASRLSQCPATATAQGEGAGDDTMTPGLCGGVSTGGWYGGAGGGSG